MAVATAIVGSAVIGGVVASSSSRRASSAAESGATAAADATVQATQLQIEEIQRQFDYQTQLLQPLIEQQYAAGSAYSNLLGLPPAGQNTQPQISSGVTAEPGVQAYYAAIDAGGQVLPGGAVVDQNGQLVQPPPAGAAGEQGGGALTTPQYPDAPGVTRGAQGEFVDPNLDPTNLADINTLPGTVQENLLAPTSAEDDAFRSFVGDQRLAEGAAGTGVYGEEFESSPGYAFAVEEMERELDRKHSAGGNYGGRAIMEALRRSKGLASQDYYQWAGGRERDLMRKGGAERFDITADIGAYENYLTRRSGDVSRLDYAAGQEDSLQSADLARSDSSYYNYLDQLARMGGFGNAAGSGVAASSSAGSQAASAYGRSGATLANVYGNLGNTNAQLAYSQGANINNAFQGGVENLLTAYNAGAL